VTALHVLPTIPCSNILITIETSCHFALVRRPSFIGMVSPPHNHDVLDKLVSSPTWVLSLAGRVAVRLDWRGIRQHSAAAGVPVSLALLPMVIVTY
jgi:hypothetical protein